MRQYEEFDDYLYVRPDLRDEGLYEKQMQAIEEFIQPPGKLLDVGSGGGMLLQTARQKGWNVEGVELSKFFVTYCRNELGFKIYEGDVLSAKFPDNTFDVIVMSHLVEHLSYPQAEIAEAWRIITRGGIIVIECPNFNCPFRYLLRTKWWFLLNPGHINHFNKRSLVGLLERNGFQIVKSYYPSKSYSLELLFDRFRILYSHSGGRMLTRLVRGTFWSKLKIKFQLLDTLAVFARKPRQADDSRMAQR